ncbi:MAG: hypothetical protein NTW69_12795 [Chloroflexi bacterium]|jgi:hypothetical protein|nr:hypothetical protein [Chloroflexota bacterium]
MSNIPKVSLEDSLYVLQLARETALAQNRQAQAKRMMPLVDEMQSLVSNPPQPAAIPPSTGVMGQSDFKTLLTVTQSRVNQTATVDSTAAIMDRNRLIGAMSEANMSDVDIARQFSITRDEVQLVLNIQQNNKSYGDRIR